MADLVKIDTREIAGLDTLSQCTLPVLAGADGFLGYLGTCCAAPTCLEAVAEEAAAKGVEF